MKKKQSKGTVKRSVNEEGFGGRWDDPRGQNSLEMGAIWWKNKNSCNK
jgi:hypothetical protein